MKGELQGQVVATAAQARDGSYCHVRKIGVVTERLATIDIGEMHLDKRNLDRYQCITKRNAGMSQPCRIYDDERRSLQFRSMYPLNEGTFVIALESFDLGTKTLAGQG